MVSPGGAGSAKPAGGSPKVIGPGPRITVTGSVLKVKRVSNGAVKVGVVGCAGRMGQMLLKMLISAPGIVVVGGSERRGSAALGQDLGALAGADPLGISVSDDPSLLFDSADVVVDFTNPTATVQHAQMAAKTGCALVIGTTGFDNDQLNTLYRAAQRAPIVLAANMSLGINLLQQVVEEVARILDPDWDIEIIEMHHRHKIDAPSGTALTLGEAAARGRGQNLAPHFAPQPRRAGRPQGQRRDRLCRLARRRCGRRPHRDLRRRRRAGGDHPPRLQPRDFRPRRREVGVVGGEQEARPLFDARRARLQRSGAPGCGSGRDPTELVTPLAGRSRRAAARPLRIRTSASRAFQLGRSPARA